MVDPNTRQGKRTPVTLKIKFKSETLEQFIERYAVDVSQGGIFIRTKEPLAVGTQMKFEFQLRDASPLIAGEGTVVWTRENDPSRPAIAPGMGVRFDRLGDGSQSVLERILSEKAKQAPQRPLKDTTKPPLFTDTPTRVAPAPIQEALLGNQSRASGQNLRARSDSRDDEKTPLPKPMPFHSDADDFGEEAFEEATKVRALDELVAQTALGGSSGSDPFRAPTPAPVAPAGPSIDELAARRASEANAKDAANAAAKEAAAKAGVPAFGESRDSAPSLPAAPANPMSSPALQRPSTPSNNPPMGGAVPAPNNPTPAKTRLGLEPVTARTSGQQSVPPETAPVSQPPAVAQTPRPAIKDAMTVPSGVHAIPDTRDRESPPPTETRLPSAKRPSSAPIIVGIILVVAAAGAALWFFILREPTIESQKPLNGSAGSNNVASGTTPGSDTTPGSGSAGSATAINGSGSNGSGSATAMINGSNGSAGSAEKPAGPMVDTTIASNVDKAAIEVTGTEMKGAAPFVAKLEKDKSYKIHATAPGFLPADLEIKGGEKPTIKLEPKKYIVDVTSDPAGAAVSVEGNIGKMPYEMKTAPKKGSVVRVRVAKSGFRPQDITIDATKWDESDTTMTFKITTKLVVAPVQVPVGPGSAKDPGSGSAKDPGSGSAKEPAGSGSGTTTPPPPPDEPEPSF